MKTAAVGLVLVAVACAGLRESPGHVPATGRYEYLGSYPAGGGSSPRTFRGTLVVTHATAERVMGRWEVPGFEPQVQLGGFAGGAYVANADVSVAGTLGTFEHRIDRAGSPSVLRCTGNFLARVGATAASYPATCSLRYLGR